MIIEIPNENSIVKWKNDDKDEWKVAEVSDLIKAYERPQCEWIPVSERLPEKEGFYLVFLENERIAVAHSDGIIANHDFEPKMLAWMPLPITTL